MQPSPPPDPFDSFHYREPQPGQFGLNPFNHPVQHPSTNPQNSFKIKLPPMTRSTRAHPVVDFDKSGSEYRESDGEDHMDTEEAQPIEHPSPRVQYTSSSRGRRYVRKTYVESESEDVDAEGEPDVEAPAPAPAPKIEPEEEDDDYGKIPRYHTRARAAGNLKDFIASEDDEDAGIRTRSRLRRHPAASGPQTRSGRSKPSSKSARNKSARRVKKAVPNGDDEDVYVHDSSSESGEHDISFDNVVTSPEPGPGLGPGEPEEEQEQERGGYGLRARAKKNYDIITMLDNITSAQAQPTKKSPRGKGRSGGNKFKGPGWSATGAELGRWMGLPGDDLVHSFSHPPVPPFLSLTLVPRIRMIHLEPHVIKGSPPPPRALGGCLLAGLTLTVSWPVTWGQAVLLTLVKLETPVRHPPIWLRFLPRGLILRSVLADADPLGVNQNVTFEEVGGLDDRKSNVCTMGAPANPSLDINALKEMTLLPLLYPEVFHRFDLTPPRGVLFHGPPGTGKTLLARALAASCRSNGKGICKCWFSSCWQSHLTPIFSILHAQGSRLLVEMGRRSRTTASFAI